MKLQWDLEISPYTFVAMRCASTRLEVSHIALSPAVMASRNDVRRGYPAMS